MGNRQLTLIGSSHFNCRIQILCRKRESYRRQKNCCKCIFSHILFKFGQFREPHINIFQNIVAIT